MGVKKYFYKIYTSDGDYIKTQNDVSDEYPVFNSNINGGLGSLTLKYARSWNDYFNSTDLDLYNELRIVISDNESDSKQIYSGYINSVILKKDDKGSEFISAQFVGYVAELPFRILEFSNGYTGLQYNSESPEDILRDVIDKYGGKITYTGSSITATGSTVTDTFNVNTVKESIDKILTRCPIGWHWFVNAENVIYLNRTDRENPDHRLYIGRQINSIDIVSNMENVVNDVRVFGGTPDGENQIYKKYYNQKSIDEFGRRTFVKSDGRIYVEATLDFLGSYLLGSNYSKSIEMEFDVIDSNINPKSGYDIESINVGDVIQIKDPKHNTEKSNWDSAVWDEDYWDYNKADVFAEPIIVKSINYYGVGCRITAAKFIPGVGFRMEDIKRNLENYLNNDLLISPSEEDNIDFTFGADGDLIQAD